VHAVDGRHFFVRDLLTNRAPQIRYLPFKNMLDHARSGGRLKDFRAPSLAVRLFVEKRFSDGRGGSVAGLGG